MRSLSETEKQGTKRWNPVEQKTEKACEPHPPGN